MEQSTHGLQQRRLSRAVGANNAGHATLLHRKVHALEDVTAAVASDDTFETQKRGRSTHDASSTSSSSLPPRYASRTNGLLRISLGVPLTKSAPWCMTVTRSQRFMTNSILCSTMRNDFPSLLSVLIFPAMSLMRVRFTPPAGSSNKMTSGSATKT